MLSCSKDCMMRDITVTVHSWSKHWVGGLAENAERHKRLLAVMLVFLHVCASYLSLIYTCVGFWKIFYQVCYVLKWVWFVYGNTAMYEYPLITRLLQQTYETTEIGCNLYKSASHKNGWRAKLLNCTKNRTSTHIQEWQPVGCYAISKAWKACAVCVTIFSRGSKFRPVSNFT